MASTIKILYIIISIISAIAIIGMWGSAKNLFQYVASAVLTIIFIRLMLVHFHG